MRFFFTLLVFCVSSFAYAQNLIPNNSLELYSDCPETLGGIDNSVENWFSLKGSSDYFNSCSENALLGWNSNIGYQIPQDGDAYGGIVFLINGQPNTREYLGVELITTLEVGVEYVLDFYVSLAYDESEFLLGSNNIGFLLLTEPFIDEDEFGQIPGYSTYHEQQVITDTSNWTLINHTFVADSAYQYIGFGNFFDDSMTDTIRIGGDPGSFSTAYYFFDNFCLSQNDNPSCEVLSADTFDKLEFQIYPNPSSGRLSYQASEVVQNAAVYDSIGNMIRQFLPSEIKNQSILLDELTAGLYFIKIEFANQQQVKKKFILF